MSSGDESTPPAMPGKGEKTAEEAKALLATSASSGSLSRQQQAAAAAQSAMRNPKRRASQKRKERFTPKKRSVSFEDDPLAGESGGAAAGDTGPSAPARPHSAVVEVEETTPLPPLLLPGDRPPTARRQELRQQQVQAEGMTLPASRPVSAVGLATRKEAVVANPALAGLHSATGVDVHGGPKQKTGLRRKTSGTFQLWGAAESSPSSGASAETGRSARPKTASSVPSARKSDDLARAAGEGLDFPARPKTAYSRSSEPALPSRLAAKADEDEEEVSSPANPLVEKPTLRHKPSVKKIGSRMRMFPGMTGGSAPAAPNWSAFEGDDDLVSLSGLQLPLSGQYDPLADDLLESDEDDGEGGTGDIVRQAAAAAAATASSGAMATGERDETDGGGVVAGRDGLFYQANQQEQLSQLRTLAGELQGEESEEEGDRFLDEFNTSVKDDLLVVGTMSVGALEEEEKRIRTEQIAVEEHAARQHIHRQEQLATLEMEAKQNVYVKMTEKEQDLGDKERFVIAQDSENMASLNRAYSRSEAQLRRALEERKAEVTTLYGDLQLADDGQYSGSRQRRWKLEWRRTPQPIEIKLKMMRGVKDKLPAGRYVMLVSLFDRLGGHILHWSNLAGQQWGGVTLPVQHRGRFHDMEMELDQSVYTVCPSRAAVKPGMVLLFEMFILRGSVVPTDRVVGWGAFPVCDAEFNIVEGRYKCAILRGERDPYIDRHSRIEQIMAKDLENWLGNLYFDILKLPRYFAGQKEYEVELQFSSAMLGFPDRLHDDQPTVDGNDPIVQSQEDIAAALRKGREDDDGDSLGQSSASVGGRKSSVKRRGSRKGSRRGRRSRHGNGAGMDAAALRPPTSVQFSRQIFDKELGASSDDDHDNDGGDSGIDGFAADPNDRGMYYKVHERVIGEDRDRHVYTMLPKTAHLKQRRKEKTRLSKAEELKMHTVSVHAPFSAKAKFEHKAGKKWSYVRRQFLSELGLSQWRSREFWAVLLMFVIVFWIRIYMHYIGQWIFLTALLIPINRFDFLWISVNLNYQPTLLYTRHELAVVLFGPLTNLFLFTLFVLLAYISLKVFNSFPNIVSRFILAFGVMAVIDPACIALVDLFYGRYVQATGTNPLPIGDAFKLYFHFQRIEGTGVAGVFLTLFSYLFTVCLAAALLYVYFLRLHLNGRMMDVFHRLNGKESDFFIPDDLEISNEELNWICRKAEQWRGKEGERRKVAVFDYVWEEADDPEEESASLDSGGTDGQGAQKSRKKKSGREVTTHVSINTLHLDGLRELFRHFLRLPDGAIVEVIGEMGLVGMETRIRSALQNVGAGRGRPVTALPTGGGTAVLGMDQALFQQPPTRQTRMGSVSSLRGRRAGGGAGDENAYSHNGSGEQ